NIFPCHGVGRNEMISEASNRAALAAKRRPRATIAAGYRHSIALTSDGRVMAIGENTYGQCDVGDWGEIVAVAGGHAHTGNSHAVGLRLVGSDVAVGWNKYGQCGVTECREIVSIAAGWRRTVGLRSDGSVLAVGRNNEGQC